MLRLKIKFLRKNWSEPHKEITLRQMALRLNCSPSTLHYLLQGEMRSTHSSLVNEADNAIELLRYKPHVVDASLLLPSQVDLKYRFATHDGAKDYTLWDLRVYPVLDTTSGNWRPSDQKPVSTLQVNEHFLPVPPHQDTLGSTLYVRDLDTRLWYKLDHSIGYVFPIDALTNYKPRVPRDLMILEKLKLYERDYE